MEPYAQTLDRPLPFNPVPQLVAQLGRNPLRRFDHRMVTGPFGPANPLAVLPLFTRSCLSGLRHQSPPAQPSKITQTRLSTGYHQTGRSPSAVNLGLLPCHYPHSLSSVQLGAWFVEPRLTRLPVRAHHTLVHALRHGYMLAAPDQPRLPSCGDEPNLDFAFLPVLDSQSPYDESC